MQCVNRQKKRTEGNIAFALEGRTDRDGETERNGERARVREETEERKPERRVICLFAQFSRGFVASR